jgi:hypothetical protein
MTAAQPDYAATMRQFPDDTWTDQTRDEWIEVAAEALYTADGGNWTLLLNKPTLRKKAATVVDALLAHLAAQQPRPTHGGGQP